MVPADINRLTPSSCRETFSIQQLPTQNSHLWKLGDAVPADIDSLTPSSCRETFSIQQLPTQKLLNAESLSHLRKLGDVVPADIDSLTSFSIQQLPTQNSHLGKLGDQLISIA